MAAGDALPAQFQITLAGGAWKAPSPKARGLFVQSTIHEAVHLWQAGARPITEEAPEWIHEGAADADPVFRRHFQEIHRRRGVQKFAEHAAAQAEPGVDQDLGQHAGSRRRDLERHLVGLELDQRLVGGDRVARPASSGTARNTSRVGSMSE